MDGIGVGPAGPPVPPEALFSVIPYPMEREAPMMGDSQRYAFVSNNAGDTNVGDDPSSKSDLSEVEKPVVDKKVCLFVCFSSSNILCFRFLFIFYLCNHISQETCFTVSRLIYFYFLMTIFYEYNIYLK